MKETNAQKIARFYTISKVNKKYQEIVSLHQNKVIDDYEFIFRADKIYSNDWRVKFLDLNEWKNDIVNKNNKNK